MTVCVCAGTVTFIGSHLDVVPSNPDTWERDPFKPKVEVCYIASVVSLYRWSLNRGPVLKNHRHQAAKIII